MPLDRSLARDASLFLLLASLSCLPLVQTTKDRSPSSLRTQVRDLSRAVSYAVAAVLGGTGALVLVGGVVVGAERAWGRCKAWWRGEGDEGGKH
ncbi:hypothetical protein JCM6882_003546 [Rhodosporidiobolus microsporus]